MNENSIVNNQQNIFEVKNNNIIIEKIDKKMTLTEEIDTKKNEIINSNNNYNNNNENNIYDNENPKNKKKKKVSFIDEVNNERDIAQIIYINDQVPLKEDKVDINKCFEILRKQSTNISEFFRRENLNNETQTYKIKRPRKSHFKQKRKNDKINQQCTCTIF